MGFNYSDMLLTFILPPVEGIKQSILQLRGRPNKAGFIIDINAAKFKRKGASIYPEKVNWYKYNVSIGPYGNKIYAKYVGKDTLPSYLYYAEIIAQLLNKYSMQIINIDSYLNSLHGVIENALSGKITEVKASKKLFNMYIKLSKEIGINTRKDRLNLIDKIINELFTPFKYVLYTASGLIVITIVAVKLTGVSIPIPGTPVVIGGKGNKLITRKPLPPKPAKKP